MKLPRLNGFGLYQLVNFNGSLAVIMTIAGDHPSCPPCDKEQYRVATAAELLKSFTTGSVPVTNKWVDASHLKKLFEWDKRLLKRQMNPVYIASIILKEIRLHDWEEVPKKCYAGKYYEEMPQIGKIMKKIYPASFFKKWMDMEWEKELHLF